jgi:hypothetical protein
VTERSLKDDEPAAGVTYRRIGLGVFAGVTLIVAASGSLFAWLLWGAITPLAAAVALTPIYAPLGFAFAVIAPLTLFGLVAVVWSIPYAPAVFAPLFVATALGAVGIRLARLRAPFVAGVCLALVVFAMAFAITDAVRRDRITSAAQDLRHDCIEIGSLWATITEFDDAFRFTPHAVLIDRGEVFVWSFRLGRFDRADPRVVGNLAVTTCRPPSVSARPAG